MRALILSDIHANLNALQAVLKDAGQVDAVWCLGDVIGYGPDPNECISLLRDQPNVVSLLGNHDAASLGRISLDTFNQEARDAIYWTRTSLRVENSVWLTMLSESGVMENVTLAHGSPRNPLWEYLLDPVTAGVNFEFFETDVCFVGHTHLPIVFTYTGENRPARWNIPLPDQPLALKPRLIINPGSVGQPRDHDPRASYGILDTKANTWLPKRVVYEFKSVQSRILEYGLPDRHAVRLAEGW